MSLRSIRKNISINTDFSILDQIKHQMIGTDESNLSSEFER